MSRYEEFLIKKDYISIHETDKLPSFQSGCYVNGEIYINKYRSPETKLETLAEEIAHYETSYGNILNTNNPLNKKFELKARRVAHEMLISLDNIIEAFNYGVSNLFEMAEYFEVTCEYVIDCLNHYKQKHGLNIKHNDYLITFEPLQVQKLPNG